MAATLARRMSWSTTATSQQGALGGRPGALQVLVVREGSSDEFPDGTRILPHDATPAPQDLAGQDRRRGSQIDEVDGASEDGLEASGPVEESQRIEGVLAEQREVDVAVGPLAIPCPGSEEEDGGQILPLGQLASLPRPAQPEVGPRSGGRPGTVPKPLAGGPRRTMALSRHDSLRLATGWMSVGERLDRLPAKMASVSAQANAGAQAPRRLSPGSQPREYGRSRH